ncbi:MAG: DUF58 domain-containing protein [Gaiellales bacterium]
MLTARGRQLLGVSALLYLVAWGFGTRAMFPIPLGLSLAVLGAYLWVRLLTRPMRLRRKLGYRELVEGGRVAVGIELRPDGGGPLPGRARLIEQVGDLGIHQADLVHSGHYLRGRYVIDPIARGRYRLDGARLMLEDPFGLSEAVIPLERTDTLLVYPRVYELDGLFTDSGSAGGDDGRSLLHRTAGYDLHSIRDFQQGESLRRVHWRSTAKRRKLMVKELTEQPRDEAAVLLDCDETAVAGSPPDTSFDAQVRVAASIMNSLAGSGQRCSLVIHGASRTRFRVQSGGGRWAEALAELAAVRADAPRPLAAVLSEVIGPAGGADSVDAARMYVVTAAMTPLLAERLLGARTARRDVSVVWVDAPSFAGAHPSPGPPDAAALHLARAGIALARVRAGDHIGEALSATPLRAVSRA